MWFLNLLFYPLPLEVAEAGERVAVMQTELEACITLVRWKYLLTVRPAKDKTVRWL